MLHPNEEEEEEEEEVAAEEENFEDEENENEVDSKEQEEDAEQNEHKTTVTIELKQGYEGFLKAIVDAGGTPARVVVPSFPVAKLYLNKVDLYLAQWLERKSRNRWSRAVLLDALRLAKTESPLLQTEKLTEYRLRKLQKVVDAQLGVLKATSSTFYLNTPTNKCTSTTVAYIPCEWFLRQAFAQPTLAFEMENWTNQLEASDIYREKRWQQLVTDGELNEPTNVMLGLYFDDYDPAKFSNSPQLKLSSLRLVPLNYRNKVRSDVYNWWTPAIFPTFILKHFDRAAILAPFYQEMKRLEEGILIYNSYQRAYITVTCRVITVIADLPAKAFLTHSQSSFSSMKAWCIRCYSKRNDPFTHNELKTAQHYQTLGDSITALEPTCQYRKTLIAENNITGKSQLFGLKGLEPKHIVNDLMHNELQGGCLVRNIKAMFNALREGKAWSKQHDRKLNDLFEMVRLPRKMNKPQANNLYPSKATHKLSILTAMTLVLPALQQGVPCSCSVSHKVTPRHLVSAFHLLTNKHTALDHYLCCRAYLLIAAQLFCREPPTNTAQLEKSIRAQQEYFQHLYGSNIKPKMHYLSHYPEDIELWGSLRHLWCFPGERLNGLEGKEQTNWHQDASSRQNMIQRQRAFRHHRLDSTNYDFTIMKMPIGQVAMTPAAVQLFSEWVCFFGRPVFCLYQSISVNLLLFIHSSFKGQKNTTSVCW
ncbi:hypothetical protein QOT17_021102 [Balamuthia mandrillaris]